MWIGRENNDRWANIFCLFSRGGQDNIIVTLYSATWFYCCWKLRYFGYFIDFKFDIMYREVSCIQVYLLVESFFSGLFGLVVLFEIFQMFNTITTLAQKLCRSTTVSVCVYVHKHKELNLNIVKCKWKGRERKTIHHVMLLNKFNHNSIYSYFSRRQAQKFSISHLKFRFACGQLTFDEILILEN